MKKLMREGSSFKAAHNKAQKRCRQMSLDRWFKEKWVDVKTGKKCGRGKNEKGRPFPACRPSKRISSKTPKTTSEMSSKEKAKFKREKTSSKNITYQHRRKRNSLKIA